MSYIFSLAIAIPVESLRSYGWDCPASQLAVGPSGPGYESQKAAFFVVR